MTLRSLTAAALLLMQLASPVNADLILEEVAVAEECGLVMFDVYGEFEWPGVGGAGYYDSLCRNPNPLISMYAGIITYCLPEHQEASKHILAKWCKMYGETEMLPESDFAANLTKDAIAALPVYNAEDLEEESNQTAPFMMSQAWFDITMLSEHDYDREQRLYGNYTMAGFGFWFAILVFGMVQNAIRKVSVRRRSYVYADAEGHPPSTATTGPPTFLGRAAALSRKYFITPSLLPPYHQRRLLGCTIPTRAVSFTVFSYWAVTIVLSCVNYHAFNGNIFFDTIPPQLWRYIADRTGVMSYGNLPLLWMFSGRNNVFIWLTGWSFGTFNMFHRHIARIATIQGIMHSLGYTFYYFTGEYSEYYYTNYEQLYWSIGVAATVVMSFIILFSFSFFRSKLYENFLLIHIVLSVLLIVFLYYHTNIFDLSQYNYPFLLTTSIIWGFDRFVRLLRQGYVNLYVSRNRGKGLQTTKATVTYDEASNMLTLDVIPANTHLFAGPGQHYFIYQPLRFLGWENHPFTLAHWTQSKAEDELRLQFWVRPYDGWTKKLKRDCLKKGASTGNTISTAILLEGPYGAAEPVHLFEHVLLIAGGSGIAGVMPYLQDYLRRSDEGAAAGPNGRIPTRTRHVTLVWSDRSEKFIRFVVDTCLGNGLLARPDITVNVHLSGEGSTAALAAQDGANHVSTASSSTDAVDSGMSSPVTPGTAVERTLEELDPEKTGVFTRNGGSSGSHSLDGSASKEAGVKGAATAGAASYTIQAGRPDVLSTVRNLAQSAHDTNTRLAVMMCGPDDMADNVRYVVGQSMTTTSASIEYFEESFGW